MAELTATPRVGFHRYTFPADVATHFIVDLAHGYGERTRVLSSEMSVVGKDTVLGGRRVDAWAKGRHIYFAMRFSRPFASARLISAGEMLDSSERDAKGTSLKCVLAFPVTKSEVIQVKVGISGVSAEGALKNLEAEIPGWDFGAVRSAASQAWD